MAMMAVGVNYFIKGGNAKDIQAVKKIIESYVANDLLFEHHKPGEVRTVDSLSNIDERTVGLDLSKKGEIKIVFVDNNDTTESIFLYRDGDRQILLEQIVLMTSGFKTLDSDWLDIKRVLHQGSATFRWIAANEDNYVRNGEHLLKEILKETSLNKMDLYLQIANLDTPLMLLYKLIEIIEACSAISEVVFQVVGDGDERDNGIISIFYPQ